MEAGNRPPPGMPLTGLAGGGTPLGNRGLLRVGENGPELLRLDNYGVHVMNASRTRDVMNDVQWGGSRTVAPVFHNHFYGVGYEVQQVIDEAVNKSVSITADLLHEEVFSGPSPTRRSDPLGY
jgi:hypothetical protein